MAAPVWKIVVTDLYYNPLGELTDAIDFNLTRKVSGVDSASFKLRDDNRFFSLFDTQECCVKYYRDNVLEGFHNVYNTDMVGDADSMSIQVNTVAPPQFADRWLPQYQFSFVNNVSADRLQLLYTYASMLQTYNGQKPAADPNGTYSGYTTETAATLPIYVPFMTLGRNIGRFDVDPASGQDMTFATFASIMQDCSAGIDGFEYIWTPTEPLYTQTAVANPIKALITSNQHTTTTTPVQTGTYPSGWYSKTIATLNAATQLGSLQSGASFEYGAGTRANLAGFSMNKTREYQIGNPFVRQAGLFAFPSVTLPGGSQDRKWGTGYMSEQEDYGLTGDLGLTANYNAQQSFLNQTLLLRALPRRRIEITPMPLTGSLSDPPRYGVDYGLGDTVSVQLRRKDGSYMISGNVRIYSITFTRSESGSETAALTISES